MSAELFSTYVLPGDSIEIEEGNYIFTVRLEQDYDTSPNDYDCYERRDIERWYNNEWFYGGLIVSVTYNDIPLDDHAASLWGIECNFVDGNNDHLNDIALELVDEAREQAPQLLEELRSRLAA